MASKYEMITQIYESTIFSVTKSPENWMTFITEICTHYKYQFDEQILIYAQKPNATACADINTWNRKVGRWVNRGAKGIALFNEDNSYMKLKYVFDVSDTHDEYNRSFKLWETEEKYNDQIIESLEARFGELKDKSTLEQAIISAVTNAVEDNIPDYLESLIENKSESFLEELDDLNVEVRLRTLLINSISTMVMARCYKKPFEYFDTIDFKDIIDFNTHDTITILGTATSDIAENTLREIQRTVRKIQINEKKQNHTVEQKENKVYDSITNKTNENIERSVENENRIHNAGGLQFTESNSTKSEGNINGQIRKDEINILEGTQERSIQDTIYEERATRPFDGNRESIQTESRANSGRNEENREHNRRTESSKSNEVGTTNEQFENDGRGNSNQRNNLQLGNYEKDSNRSCPYVVTDDKINQMLSVAPHLRVSNSEIINYFNNEEDREKRAEFLKGIMNIDYTELIINDERYGYKAFDNGLLTWKGSYLSRNTESFNSWEELTQNYNSMILLNQLKDKIERLPSVTDQMSLIGQNQEKSELEFSQEFVDRVLQEQGTESKYRLYKRFRDNISLSDNTEYLKKTYGQSYYGSSGTVKGSGIGLQCNPKGMTLYRGYFKNRIETTIGWNKVAKRISELITLNRFLNEKEIEQYPNWLNKQKEEQEINKTKERLSSVSPTVETEEDNLAKRIMSFIDISKLYNYIGNTVVFETEDEKLETIKADIIDEMNIVDYVKAMQNIVGNMGANDEKLEEAKEILQLLEDRVPKYEYHLGDKVYIGADEYEILSMNDDKVCLYDSKFPLFNKELDRKEFEIRVKENYANEHLKVTNKMPELENNTIENYDSFSNWLDTFIEEKGINLDETFTIETDSNLHIFKIGNVIENIKTAPREEQVEIKDMLVKIDFSNGNVVDYFKHLAKALVENVDMEKIPEILELNNETPSNRELENEEIAELEQKLYEFVNKYNIYDIDEVSIEQVKDDVKTTKDITKTIEYLREIQKQENEENEFSKELKDIVFALETELENKKANNQLNPELLELIINDLMPVAELDEKIYVDKNITLDTKIELLIKEYEYASNDFGYLNPTEGYYYMDDVGVNVRLYNKDESEYIIKWKEFAKVFIKYIIDEKNKKQEIVEKQENSKNEITRKPKKNKIQSYDLHPEVKEEERINFKIQDNELGYGTPREKYRKNIDAIKTLKLCENENRYATQQEQSILSKYVGWGGLANAFDKNDNSWKNEYLELKELLTEEEYKSAKASTLTAYYTPPNVIRSMYKVLNNLGLKDGNILEPSCGIGNFIGMLPQSLENCKTYGIELDDISGRIAGQLYQKSNIAISKYERVDLPDSFFDVAIGNVPFGNQKIYDKRYDKNNFLIHDYFFGKTLDKVRPGGVIAFITSKGTMDKQNPAVRKYIAQRADLLGAIRLPDNTFTKNAGTRVTSDILFLQKKENMTDIMPEWVYLDTNEDGITMNKYFVDNPEMILGNMVMEKTAHGLDSACKPHEDTELDNLLDYAINNIYGEIEEYSIEDIDDDEKSIVADPNVKNFSYCLVEGQVYFRENSKMFLQELPITTINRIRGMIELRECVGKLIDLQTEDGSEYEIEIEQRNLNRIYDNFTKKYGLINSRGNNLAFSDDSSYYLLCSLEVLDSSGRFIRKADMFSKRTIRAYKEITSVDTANEALILSLSEKGRVDLDYMSKITEKTHTELKKELSSEIYRLPLENDKYVTADEYLSGNIREKLKLAEKIAETDEDILKNVEALKKVLPERITASEISVRLGATWIPTEIIEQFMYELLDTPNYAQWKIKVGYFNQTGEWYIKEKSYDYRNVKANKTYGTDRVNAYKIIEQTLNLKDIKIFDTVINSNGEKERVFNKTQTAIVQAKQEQIRNAFLEWIWKDQARREMLENLYNEKFNSIRPREYDGSYLSFSGMNPEIDLRVHQRNAVAQGLYGGNELLALEVRSRKNIYYGSDSYGE